MSKRKGRRPSLKDRSTYVKGHSRIDPNKAAAYNAQRSKATTGSRDNSLHNPDTNFLKPIPETERLSSPIHNSDDIPWFFNDEYLNAEERVQLLSQREKLRHKHQPVWRRSERGKVIDSRQDLLRINEQGLIKLYQVWAGGRRQGIGQYFTRVLKENKETGYKFFLFFSGNQYILVQEVPLKHIRRISRIYDDVSTAANRAESMDIAWKIIEQIKTPK